MIDYSSTLYNVDYVVRGTTVIPRITVPRTTVPRTTSAFEQANVQRCTKPPRRIRTTLYSNASYNVASYNVASYNVVGSQRCTNLPRTTSTLYEVLL